MPRPRENAGLRRRRLLYATVEAFDPAQGAWTSKTSAPTPLTSVGAVSIGAAIYVFAPFNSFGYVPADDPL
jgi:hypothetical protein